MVPDLGAPRFTMLRMAPSPLCGEESTAWDGVMVQKITTGFRELVDAAEREIETLSVEEAIALHGRDDVTFIDVRDIRELEREGRVPSAFHSSARHA